MSLHYDEDFKKKIVELVESGKRRSDVSKGYGISAQLIRYWQSQYGKLPVNKKDILKEKNTIEAKK